MANNNSTTEKIYSIEELEALAPIFVQAASIWREDHGKSDDIGSCTLGAGLAIQVVKSPASQARPRIAVHAPGQNGGKSTMERATRFLADRGVICRYEHGRVD